MSGRRCTRADGRASGIAGGSARQGRRGNREGRRELADEDGDGVLELRALHAEIDELRARGLHLLLRLCHVASSGHARVVAVGGQVQCLLERVDRRLQQRRLGVDRPHLQIVGRDLGVHAEPDTLEVGGARLHSRASGGDALAHPSPHVRLVRRIDRQHVLGCGLRRNHLVRARGRHALPGDRRIHGDGRRIRRAVLRIERPRLLELRRRLLHGLARTSTAASSAFNAGSPKSVHQSPLTAASAGEAGVHATPDPSTVP